MLKYTNKNVTLLVTDRQYKYMDKDYINVVGKMDAVTLNFVLDKLIKLVNEKFTKMKIGEYCVKIYTENSGYAKSCKWKKNSIRCNFIVEFETASKFRIKEFSFERIFLFSGEYRSDKILTNNFNARKNQLELMTKISCCVNLDNVRDFELRIDNEKRIYNDFLSKMCNFEI